MNSKSLFPIPQRLRRRSLMSGGRCRSSPAPELASLLENDDLLSEFLLRLPPSPSSLLRASLVCKRWLSLVSEQGFLRRFRAHHTRHPPLVGFFAQRQGSILFTPILVPPDRIPCDHFSVLLDDLPGSRILCCRHGLVLLLLPTRLLVWDPSSWDKSVIPFPWEFDSRAKTAMFNGAVLRDAGDVDGDDHLGDFQFQAALVLERSFELEEFLQRSSHQGSLVEIVGIAEDKNVFYLQAKTGVFMVHMESMQCKKVSEMSDIILACHSFTSVYTAGI